MNQKDRHDQIRRLPAVALVCFLAALNASQGMFLCVGAGGHVAIEPLGHRHCDGAVHDHEHDVDAQSSRGYDRGYAAQERCHPCVDIPLTLGPVDERILASPPNTVVALVIGEPPASLCNADASPDASDRTLLPSRQTALRSVVLQV